MRVCDKGERSLLPTAEAPYRIILDTSDSSC